MLELNLWIVYDADGNIAVSTEGESEAYEKYREDIGNDGPTRCQPISLKAPEPRACPTLRGTVPEETCEGAELVAE